MSSNVQEKFDLEKDQGSVDHLEHIGDEKRVADTEQAAARVTDLDHGFEPAEVKHTLRKVDWRLIPVLAAMYTVSAMDRANLSLARAANHVAMNTDLGLATGNAYSLVTLAFFIPYIVLEIPSQVGLRKFGARIWLGGATVAWGLVMLGMGYAKDWQTLAGLRALLGAFEATLFPGSAYLISCWYPRHLMASRMTYFFQGALFASAPSPILSYGISQMHGRQGKHGWNWIFILYGIITVVIGIIAILLIVDFPDKATFLNERERHIVITRIERDRRDAVPDPLTLSKCLKYACEIRTWLFGMFFCSAALTVYALAYFMPTILASMGFNNAEVQLLSAPPNFYSLIPAVICAKISDRYKLRGQMVMFNCVCVITGVCMFSQLSHSQKAARYVGVFLATGGCQSKVPLVTSWAQTTIRSQSRRAFTSALIVAWGGIGGIMASVSFIQKEAKKGYPTGIYLTLAMNAFTFVAALALVIYFKARNRKADRGEAILEGDANFRYQ